MSSAEVTQRQVGVSVSVTSLGDAVLWGRAEDGALNGGRSLQITIDNSLAGQDNLVLTVWRKTTPADDFVASAVTIPVAAGLHVSRIEPIGGYAMRITGRFDVGTHVVVASVEVQS